MAVDRLHTAVAPNDWYAGELRAARDKYLRDWPIVKRARFNAAKRFERKYNASILAFSMAGIVGIALPYFTQLFGGALTPHTKNVLEFYGYITGTLSLGLGLVEQARGYESLSRRFDECGRRVNAALRRLRNNPALDERVLTDLVTEYERALDVCDINHDEIDQEIALAEEAREQDRQASRGAGQRPQHADAMAKRLAALRRREYCQIYWLYWVALCAPTAVAALIWIALAP